MSAWIRVFFDQPTIVVHMTKKFPISFAFKVPSFHAKELPEFSVTEVITVLKKLPNIYFYNKFLLYYV
jgi:hypothetical protein